MNTSTYPPAEALIRISSLDLIGWAPNTHQQSVDDLSQSRVRQGPPQQDRWTDTQLGHPEKGGRICGRGWAVWGWSTEP